MYLKYLERIIPENLLPHFIDEKNPTSLIHKLLDLTSDSIFDEPVEASINLGNGVYLDICTIDDIDSQRTRGFKFRRYESAEDFRIIAPSPPSYRGYCYNWLINTRKNKIMTDASIEAKKILNPNLSEKKCNHIAKVKIQQLKEAALELQNYSNEHYKSEDKTINYVIDLLKQTLIDLIRFTQEQYKWLSNIKIQSDIDLRSELFERRFDSPPIQIDRTREMIHSLFVDLHGRIFTKYNDVVFSCENEKSFHEIFVSENVMDHSFKVFELSKFYYLLHCMWDNKKHDIKKKFPTYSKQSYLEPFIKKYKLSFKSFNNRKVITENLTTSDPVFKKEIDIFFK